MNQEKSSKGIFIARIMIVIILTMTLCGYAYGMRISEIMFNPDGADSGREWIEVELNSSDGCINLTQYKLSEENTNHNIYPNFPYTDIVCKYAIISNDVNKFLSDYEYLNRSSDIANNPSNISIYKSSFSLSNTGEEVALKLNNQFIDYINYSLILSQVSVNEGYALEYADDAWRSSILMKGNPGNIFDESESGTADDNMTITYNNTNNITIGINTTIETNDTNEGNITDDINNTSDDEGENNISLNISVIDIGQNQTDNNSDDDEDSLLNITDNDDSDDTAGNVNNNTGNNSNAVSNCRVSIKSLIKNMSTMYENDIPIKFYNILEFENTTFTTKNYSIEYWVEDLSGNIVKNKLTTANQDEKTFTPKIDDDDKILLIKNVIKYIDCIITNDSSETILIIRNSNYTSSSTKKCPSCECQSVKEAASSNSKCASIPLESYIDNTQCSEEKPLLKIVNVCNLSSASLKNLSDVQKNASQTIKKLSNIDGADAKLISNISNDSQSTGKTTGMIVYESPNLKNRIYALIGLILVGVTCLGMIFYKVFRHRFDAIPQQM